MAEKDLSRRVVAVTGRGTINSAGKDVESYWNAVRSGQREDIITNDREWLLSQVPTAYRKNLKSHLVGRVKSDNLVEDLLALKSPAYEHIDERYAERYLSRSAILGLIAVHEAMMDADVIGQVDPKRLAFVLGTGIGGGIEISPFKSMLERGEKLPPTGMPKTQPENAMIQLAIAYGAKGPSQTITAACSAANAAFADAMQKIKRGKADMIVTGGVEGFDPLMLALFERTRAADTSEDPSTASRTFHPERQGAIASEAASVLVLEELESAKARGAKILGIVSGAGQTNDASDVTLLTKEGIEDAMNLALEEAGVTEEDFIHISAHATAAPRGDPVERDAFLSVFNGKRYHLDQIRRRVYGPKAITGHALGAANGSEAVAATKVLTEGEFPPSTWNADGVIDGMEDLITSTDEAEVLPVTVVLSNGMGFGGQNTSIVFQSYKAFQDRYR